MSHKIHSLKSRDYDEADLAELGRRLNSIAFGMGFARLEIEVIDAMTLWIAKQFGDISMQEIALAFELVTAKKLPMGKNEGRHYAKFDMQYVGDVLHNYKSFRNRQVKLFNEAEASKKILEGETKGVTGKEMYEGMKKIALEKGQVMRVANWTIALGYAWKNKLIPHMDEKERAIYKESIIKALETEKRAGFIPMDFNIDDSIQAECHKRILQSHFQNMIDEKTKTNN